MARKRQVDPELFSDEDMGELSIEARYFYVGLWCYSEDTGVFEVKFKTLKARVFPYDDVNVETFYDQLKEMGKIIEYEGGGKKCAFIKSFHRRQCIQHPSKSYLPLPPEPYKSGISEKIRLRNMFNCLNEDSMRSTVVFSEDSSRIELNRREKKRIEEKRIEMNLIEGDELSVIHISDDEIKNFGAFYRNSEELARHLNNRGVGEQERSRVIKLFESREGNNESFC